MTIVTSETLGTSTQGNRLRAKYRFQDHLGVWHKTHADHALGTDTDAYRTAQEAVIEAALDDAETEGAEDRVMGGEDSLAVVQNPVHSTDKKLAKKLIRRMMQMGKSDEPEDRQKAIYMAIVLKPLTDYLDANYTPTQLQNFLDITAGQLTTMNTRLNKVHTHYADLISFLDTAEEWE